MRSRFLLPCLEKSISTSFTVLRLATLLTSTSTLTTLVLPLFLLRPDKVGPFFSCAPPNPCNNSPHYSKFPTAQPSTLDTPMASRAVYHVHELLTHIAEQLWHGDKPDYKTLYRLSLASEFGNKVAQPILWKSLHSHDALTVFFPHNRGLDYPSPWQWSFDWQPSGWFTLNDGSPFSVPISSHYRTH